VVNPVEQERYTHTERERVPYLGPGYFVWGGRVRGSVLILASALLAQDNDEILQMAEGPVGKESAG